MNPPQHKGHQEAWMLLVPLLCVKNHADTHDKLIQYSETAIICRHIVS